MNQAGILSYPAASGGPVTVAVATGGQTSPVYRITVRNGGATPVHTTLRQELPKDTTPVVVSDDGQVAPSAGGRGGTEVSWRLRVPASAARTVSTTLRSRPAGSPVTAPACAFQGNGDGDLPYDCASATWSAVRAEAAEPVPWWRRPVVGTAGAATLVLAAVFLVWRRARRRRRSRELAMRQMAIESEPNLYPRQPRPATPAWRARAPHPPGWLVVGVAAAVLAGMVVVVAWATTARVTAIDTGRQPSNGAWLGHGVSGPVGAPLRESAFEFTVYRVSCGRFTVPTDRPTAPSGSAAPVPGTPTAPVPGGTTVPATPTAPVPSAPSAGSGSPAPPGPGATPGVRGRPTSQRQCRAIVGLRNISGRDQLWYGTLQRAYQSSGNWVTADEAATRMANGGRDLFAQPVPAGNRMVVPLVFSMSGSAPPSQLELRSAVFSAGVRVDVR